MGRKSNQEELFKIRFQEREEELKNLYMELYHNDQQAYDYFAGCFSGITGTGDRF